MDPDATCKHLPSVAFMVVEELLRRLVADLHRRNFVVLPSKERNRAGLGEGELVHLW